MIIVLLAISKASLGFSKMTLIFEKMNLKKK